MDILAEMWSMRRNRTGEGQAKSIPGRGNDKCKTPEAGICWVCFINRKKKSRMAGLEQRWRRIVREITQISLGTMALWGVKILFKGRCKVIWWDNVCKVPNKLPSKCSINVGPLPSVEWRKSGISFFLFRNSFYFYKQQLIAFGCFQKQWVKKSLMHVSFPDWSVLASFSVPVKSHHWAVVFILQTRTDVVWGREKICMTEIDLAGKRKQDTGEHGAK